MILIIALKGLGVTQVITPVRRSTRNQENIVYLPSFSQDLPQNMAQQDLIHTLLEEHDFAYVPNKVIVSSSSLK